MHNYEGSFKRELIHLVTPTAYGKGPPHYQQGPSNPVLGSEIRYQEIVRTMCTTTGLGWSVGSFWTFNPIHFLLSHRLPEQAILRGWLLLPELDCANRREKPDTHHSHKQISAPITITIYKPTFFVSFLHRLHCLNSPVPVVSNGARFSILPEVTRSPTGEVLSTEPKLEVVVLWTTGQYHIPRRILLFCSCTTSTLNC